MSSGISNEWLWRDKLSGFTRDLFENLKMKTSQFHPLNFELGKKFLSGKGNLFEAVPSVAQQMLIDNNWLSEDLNNMPSENDDRKMFQNSLLLTNFFTNEEKMLLSSDIIHATQELFNSGKKSGVISDELENLCHMFFDSTLDKSMNCTLSLDQVFPNEVPCVSKTIKKSVFLVPTENSLCVPLISTSEFINNSMSKPKETLRMENCGKKSKSNFDFNEELVIRKTKELSKHSKKRRRRQKKKTIQPSDIVKKDKDKIKMNVGKVHASRLEDEVDSSHILSGSPSHVSGQRKMNSEITCVSFDDFKSGLELAFCDPFIASSDSDSDWDVCSHDQTLIEAEFSLSGMFVASFTTFCKVDNLAISKQETLYDSIFSNTCDSSEFLRNVNKLWNESNKKVDAKPKLPSKVSFVSDDKLVQATYVDYYERKGEWEILASERLRFKKRIKETEIVISPCLTELHRNKMFERNTNLVL